MFISAFKAAGVLVTRVCRYAGGSGYCFVWGWQLRKTEVECRLSHDLYFGGLGSGWRAALGAGLFSLFLLFFPVSAAWGNTVSQADIDALVSDIEALKERLAERQAERSEMAQRLEQTERDIAENRQRLARVERQLADTQAELSELEDRQRELNQRRREQADNIEDMLVAVYKSNQQTPLKALLAPESLSHGQRMMAFYQSFNAAQLAELRAYEQTLIELSDVAASINERQDDLAAQNEQLVEENNRLMRSRNQRQQVVARLADEIASVEAEVEEKEAERAELEALLREVEEAIDQYDFGEDEIPFTERRGQMGWPVEGNVSLGYGQRNERTNIVSEGVLIRTQSGNPVRAVHYGRVVFADYLKGYGLIIIIDHGEGYLSLYGRNETLERNVGDWVRSGDTIAQAGDTGGFSEPALYFEIRQAGRTTDPMNWLAR